MAPAAGQSFFDAPIVVQPFSIAVSLLCEEPAMENENKSRFPFQRLDVYIAARQLAAAVHAATIRDAELRDQATRAAKSAFLNLCEGLPDDRAAMRRKYFVQSDNSLHETVGAVDLAAAVGALAEGRAEEIQALAFRVRGMLRGLIRASARAA
jgi:four helix bundle protein